MSRSSTVATLDLPHCWVEHMVFSLASLPWSEGKSTGLIVDAIILRCHLIEHAKYPDNSWPRKNNK